MLFMLLAPYTYDTTVAILKTSAEIGAGVIAAIVIGIVVGVVVIGYLSKRGIQMLMKRLEQTGQVQNNPTYQGTQDKHNPLYVELN